MDGCAILRKSERVRNMGGVCLLHPSFIDSHLSQLVSWLVGWSSQSASSLHFYPISFSVGVGRELPDWEGKEKN